MAAGDPGKALAVVVAVCAVLYGLFWFGKSASYAVYYRGAVGDTVRELVRDDCLVTPRHASDSR